MLDNPMQKETLPDTPTELDLDLPTRIAAKTEQIAELRKRADALMHEIAERSVELKELTDSAFHLGVYEDGNYKIVRVPVYPRKSVDVGILERIYPEYHSRIVENVKVKIESDMAGKISRIGEYITQADVKAVVKDAGILAVVIPQPSNPDHYDISVVKKGGEAKGDGTSGGNTHANP